MRTLPSVSVICANASTNGMGRALLIADLLRTETRVQVVGVGSKPTVWAPALTTGIPVRSFTVPDSPVDYRHAIPWLRDAVGDDFVIVTKPVFQSLGLAMASRVGARGRVIDIDDWESGLIQQGAYSEGMVGLRQGVARAKSYAARFGANRFLAARLLEEYAKHLPHRLVSNRWLHVRFGGEILYHVRDPRVLDPHAPVQHATDSLPGGPTWVGFIGTPRPHKGVGVLVEAVALAQRRADVGLVVMGVDVEDDPILARARRLIGGDRFRTWPQFPFVALRDHLRVVDVVALPSLDVPAAWGQIPAKLFDGMAMAKPVVASALNDMPEILRDVGLVVPPGDVAALSEAIVKLAKDPDLRRELGARGRERLIERYSYSAGRAVLLRAMDKALAGTRP
jgi:glycosyltransferase involved in cell wall biosynthesis